MLELNFLYLAYYLECHSRPGMTNIKDNQNDPMLNTVYLRFLDESSHDHSRMKTEYFTEQIIKSHESLPGDRDVHHYVVIA